MTAPHNTDRLIRAFLIEGQTDLPDRAFDAVRGDIHRTRQRVVIGPWREPRRSTLARVAIAAAAIAAIGLAWVNFGQPQRGVGNQPAPSASPQPVTTTGIVKPGRYRLNVDPADAASPRIVATLPAGWFSDDGAILTKNYGTYSGAAFGAWQVTGTVVDPCTNHQEVQPTPKAGVAGIDALAEALANQPGTSAGPPTPVTIDGYRGKLVELTVTADISKCGNGLDGFHIWSSPGGDQRYVQDSNETNRIWILDVDGKRFTFVARIPARTLPADKAELESIIASIDIEP